MEIEQITTEWWVDQGKKIPRKKSKYPETKLKWKPTKPVWHSQKKKKRRLSDTTQKYGKIRESKTQTY